MKLWWFRSWLWLLGGILIISLDIALIALFHTPQVYALGLSVILAGFIYFPLRQWIMIKLFPLDDQPLHDFLPIFSSLMAEATTEKQFEQQWQQVLQKRFQPLQLEYQKKQLDTSCSSGRGLCLQVPSLDKCHSYRLTGKQIATRRFSKTDIHAANALLDIARITSEASETREQVVMKERRRVMHDLHDTVGAHLLNLSHSVDTPQQRRAVQDTLQTLRDMIHLNLQTTPSTLEEHFADWRGAIVEQAEISGIQLDWQVDQALYDIVLPATPVIRLGLFIKETAAKLFCQADVERLHVLITNDNHLIKITIYKNDQTNNKQEMALKKPSE